MRLLLASSLRGWGGGEEWLVRAAGALSERGHEVRLAARRRSTLAARAAARGVHVHEIDYGSALDPRTAIQLARIISDQGTEVALANLDKELTALAMATVATPGVALVMRRGSDFPIKAGVLRSWVFRQRTAAVLVNSEGIARTLETEGLRLPRRMIEVIPNGLDAIDLAVSERHAMLADWPPGEGARIIAVGEVSERKNPLAVLAALSRVESPWQFLWIGDGSLLETARRRAHELGLGDRVRFLGAATDARRWTACADLLILHSSSEGQPWSVLEAVVQGVPVVTTRLPGLEELVNDGATGAVVEAGDEVGLTTAINQVLGDPGEALLKARLAQERARGLIGEALVYDRLEAILESLRVEAGGSRRAVFLDRDGTLTAEVGPVSRPESLRLLPGVGTALHALQQGGYQLIVITNQAAVGRGLVKPGDLRRVHARLRQLLRWEGVELAAIVHCPHRPEDGCDCRKPAPGMILRTLQRFRLRPESCWVVGDSIRDLGAAANAGVPAVMVATGWAGGDPRAQDLGIDEQPVCRVGDLPRAAEWILSREPA
jgi:D-glycero-D-manno-heptose 1,7-bisphosphate phosphatase